MFDLNGNLPAGLHLWTLEEVEERLVEDFPESDSRPRIWSGYLRLCRELLAIIDVSEHWLDGSFVTAKPHPGDLDLLVIAEKARLESLTATELKTFESLTYGKQTRDTHFCDSYRLVRVPEELHDDLRVFQSWQDYWLQQFGHDHSGRPKGIVRVMIQGSLERWSEENDSEGR